jgi:NTP pyrophosphatase (non-canonical NTP hydrolase)
MNPRPFEEHVDKLFVKPPFGTPERSVHAALGVGGEAGEIVDIIKKHWVYGKPLDTEKLLEECGDLLFYIAALLMSNHLTLSDAMHHNIRKLAKRYPDGYSDAAAAARADKQ